MSRYRDHSGIDNTCPLIDKVISAIESCDFSDNRYWDSKEVIEIMEEIRKANSNLREWGNEMCKERDELRDELQDQVYDLEKENNNLKIDVDYYQGLVKKLENRIDSLEGKLEKAWEDANERPI